ncbi:MAG: PilZ domain-containing protein [Candidatus Omnitrophica bacterium]|nr:PilZ domain-containing protein [Candidatus Omnitrophota bacterium]
MTEAKSEKRKYLRTAKKVPMDFSPVDHQEILLPGVGWQKGQTVNVSQGGVCVETETLNESVIRYLNQQQILLALKFHIPFYKKTVHAIGNVAWYEKEETSIGIRYTLGIKYRSIKPVDVQVLLRQTAIFKFFLYIVFILTTLFVGSLMYYFLISAR